MLEIKNLIASYPKRTVIDGLSFTLEEGKISVLIGPNGAGKSTLLKTLAGAMKPKKGELLYQGRDLFKMSPSQRAKIVAYVPQSTNLPPLTVLETVLAGRLPIFGYVSKKEDEDKTLQFLQQFGIGHLAYRNASELSGGEAQKVAIARALISNPKVLIFDEPTANLDIANQLQIIRKVQKINKEGLCVLIAMHDINLALQFGDAFIALKDGALKAQGGANIIMPELLEDLYGVKTTIIDMNGTPLVRFEGEDK